MKLAIIIVAYNQLLSLRRLVASLQQQTYKNFTMIFVDNNSKSDVTQYLKTFNSPHAVILLSNNLGYAAACNMGIKRALEEGCSHFLVLNQDIECEPAFVQSMAEQAAGDACGIITPMVLYGNELKDRSIIHTGGMSMDLIRGKHRFLNHGKTLDALSSLRSITTTMFNGAAFLISARLVQAIGYFDESFFMYGEEVDYAYRASQAGYAIATAPRAIVWHHHDWSQEKKEERCRQYYFIMRNRMLFYKKHRLWLFLLANIFYNLISFPAKLAWARGFSDMRLLKYYYWGMLRGLLGEQGKAKVVDLFKYD